MGGGGAGAEGGAGGGEGGGELTYFDVFRDVRGRLRQSPDHLPARADALVAAGDAEGLFALVRDDIVTLPPSPNSFHGAAANIRWGTRGTLRGGAGTPREKAELLAELLTRAGYAASVVVGTHDTTRVPARDLLLRSYQWTFEPPLDATDLERWYDTLGVSAAPSLTPIDPEGTESQALGAAIAAHTGAGSAAAFDFASLGTLPLVQFDQGGTPTFANPNVPGAVLGDPYTTAAPSPTGGPNPSETLYVRLEAARAHDPFTRFTLVEGTFNAEDVVGRRLYLAFPPALSTAELRSATVGDVELYIPTLAVLAPDLTPAERQALSVVGDPFTLGGDVYTVSPSQEVSVNGVSLGAGASDPTAVASVSALGLMLQSNGFPRITARLSATDASGVPVGGLGADAFRVYEDDEPVAFTVRQNQAPPPRVVLLVDASTSMPAEYLGAGAVAFAEDLIGEIYAQFPNAWVKVGTVFVGAAFAPGGWATNQLDAEVQAAWLETATGTSEIYRALAEANEEGPTVIALVTDADATDAASDEYRNAISAGVPVFTIGVGTVVQAHLDAFAELSGGTSTTAADPSAAVTAILDEIGARAAEDYVLTYRAPREGPATRSVRVELDAGRVSTEGTYSVPTSPTTPPSLSGLYLTVRAGGREYSRAIAGLNRGFTTGWVEVTDAMLADVEAAVLGRVSIAVEGGAPNPSVWLDDWFTEQLSIEPLWEAYLSGDQAQMEAAVENGMVLTPPELFVAHTPLPGSYGDSSLTFPTSMRIATYVQKAELGVGYSDQLDLFALGRFSTVADDAALAWQTTLERTAYLAVMEDALFDTSTLSLLQGIPLRTIDSGAASIQLADLDPAVTAQWAHLDDPLGIEYQMVLPQGGTPFAFWAVHKETGTTVGVLPDGSGGATRKELEANLAATNKVLDVIGNVGTLLGANVGAWVKLEQTKAALLTKATIVIATGEDPGGWEDPIKGLGCYGLQRALESTVPGLSDYFSLISKINDVGGVLGAGSVPAIPGC